MAKVSKQQWKGKQIYQLENGGLQALIYPEDGLNLFQLTYRGMELISYDKKRAEAGLTYGIPILFPTPNRTANGQFVFAHETYAAKMHGIARKAEFQVLEAKDEANACIKGELLVLPDTKEYQEFPFVCALRVTIELKKDGLTYHFEVENLDEKRLPFGLALHPFFNKISDSTLVCLHADYVMNKDEACIPDGTLMAVEQTAFDLKKGKKVSQLAVDDVYTKMTKSPLAIITYPDIQVSIEASDVFSHMVVYTPQAEPFFCIEPQTCSTDAINLYEKGKVEESGLLILEPAQKATGEVTFRVIG